MPNSCWGTFFSEEYRMSLAEYKRKPPTPGKPEPKDRQTRKKSTSQHWVSNRSSTAKRKPEKKEVIIEEKKKAIIPPTEHPKDYDELVAEVLAKFKRQKRTPMPEKIEPMLATLVNEPFDDPEWIYEVKWDGYRALAYLNKGKVELKSRNNNSFNQKFYPVHAALKEWPIKAVVDGEIVVVDEKGISAFSKLEEWKTVTDGQLEFYVFDILWLNGINLMDLPLIERRLILQRLVPENDIIRFSENFATSGTEFFTSAEKLGIEGILAKKADSVYQPAARSREWLKIKTSQRHEAVIAGYTKNEGSDKLFSALILGVYDEENVLHFIGQAGTGFNKHTQTELLKKLEPLRIKASPFREEPVINRPTRFRGKPPKTEVFWVKPELVCEVRYQELKPEGIMRHASFQGLRQDKPAAEIHEEQPLPVPVENGKLKRKKASVKKLPDKKKPTVKPLKKKR
ncbi:MAG: non-homologous end-joining DNA ligase [Chitinophagaceae bacterium]